MITSETGRFEFDALSAGTYLIIAELSGYVRGVHPPVLVLEGQSIDVRLPLALAPLSEVVNVVASTGAGEPIEQDEIREDFLRVFQLPTDRFQEALPLLPGVIRDPRGRLSFNGTRPSQSTLLVNGTNATDPVTGQFAVELPLSVIDTVEVHAIPYSAEFGQVSGAVANVRTIAGDDHWDVDIGSLIPKPRFRNGTLMGINTATPRVKVSGLLHRGSAWFSQAFSYRFVRSRVKEKIPGDDEEIVEGFDAFTQIDVKLSDRHSITGTLSVFPTDVENVGIDSLHPAFASPDMEIGGWNVAIADELATGPNTLWQTQFALRGFGVAVRPKGTGPAQLTPDGLGNNGIEWRSGFPYTVFTEDYTVVGQRNSADFPRFLSADVAVTKRPSLFGRRVDIGVQAYNLTSHDNPRDVVSNLASPSFGEFRNTVGSTISLKLGLGL